MHARARRLPAVLMLVLLPGVLLAGCAAPADDGGSVSSTSSRDDAVIPEGPREVVLHETFEGTATGAGTPGAVIVDAGSGQHGLGVPARASVMTLVLAWREEFADLDLYVESPDGDREDATGGGPGAGDSPVTIEVLDPEPGKWELIVVAKAGVRQAYTLEAEVVHVVEASALPASPDDPGTSDPGDVRVERDGPRFKATRVETFTTDLSGVGAAEVELGTVNGGIEATSAPATDSTLVAVAWAYGDTEEEAREKLADVTVDYDDSVDGEHATIGAFARLRGSEQWEDRGVSFDMDLPEVIRYDLTAGATNGGIRVAGILGSFVDLGTTNGGIALRDVEASGDVRLDTTNGGIELDRVRAAALRASTTNGGIEGDVVADDAELATTNGGIDVDLAAANDGSWTLRTTNGGILLAIPEARDRGYDLEAHTSASGRVDVDMADVETLESEENHQHVRTHGYETRAIRTVVEIATTNSDISVEGR